MGSPVDRKRDADRLKPYIVAWLREMTSGTTATSVGGGGGIVTPPATLASHVLASTSALGTYHTVAGLTSGQVLKATGATTAAFGQLLHNQLGGIGANDHHAQSHVLATNSALGADHTISGATAGHVLRASGATAAAFAQLLHNDLGGVTSDQHHAQVHNITSANHTITGSIYQVVGAIGTDTLGLLTPSADVSAGTTALLRSFSGTLGLRKITSTDTLDLDSATDRVRLMANNRIGTDNYASQITGWAIDYLGGADFRYVYTDELHAKAFIADLEQALAGGQIISKSVAVLHQTFTLPAAGGVGYFVMRDLPSASGMQVFPNGDIVRFRKFSRAGGELTISNAWGTVTLNTGYGVSGFDSATKTQGYRFDRSSAPNAGFASGDVAADAIVLDYGTTGNGFYEVNAIDGIYALNSPYAQTVTWTTHPATGQTVRTRMGNLRGIFAITDEYGLYAGGGVTDTDAYLRISNAGARFNNVGVFMYNGGLNTGLWQPDGTLLLSAANVATAADRALEFVAGAGTLRIGKTGTNKANLYWDGTALHLRQNTTPVITLGSDGNSYFAGVMTIDTAGEIRQGTVSSGNVWDSWASVGSGFTGLRVWRDTNIGRLAGYSAGVLQAGFNSTGQITAGGGTVALDANGISITLPAAFDYKNAYSFTLSGTKVGGLQAQGNATNSNISLLTENLSGRNGVVSIAAQGATGIAMIKAISGSGTVQLGLYSPAAGGFEAILSAASLQINGYIDTSTGTALELKQDGTSILKSAKTSADAYLELGAGRTVDGAAYIDLISDTTYTDYGARLVRYTGANGMTAFTHRGTGVLRFAASEAAAFQVYTGGANRFEIGATGLVGIGVTPATQKLKVLGSVAVGGDEGGTAGYVTFTNTTVSTASGSGTGTIKLNTPGSSNITTVIKVMIGTTAYYIPASAVS